MTASDKFIERLNQKPILWSLGLGVLVYFCAFWLAVLGLSMSAVVSSGNTRRGFMAAALGMLLATIGLDIISGAQRFTFGNAELMSGLGFIPVMIGLFGVSEVIRSVVAGLDPRTAAVTESTDSSGRWSALKAVWQHKGTVAKSSARRSGCHIGATLKPQPKRSQGLGQARIPQSRRHG